MVDEISLILSEQGRSRNRLRFVQGIPKVAWICPRKSGKGLDLSEKFEAEC